MTSAGPRRPRDPPAKAGGVSSVPGTTGVRLRAKVAPELVQGLAEALVKQLLGSLGALGVFALHVTEVGGKVVVASLIAGHGTAYPL